MGTKPLLLCLVALAFLGACSRKGPGITSSGEPTAIECASGTWDHDGDPTTACVVWSQCAANQYVAAPGTTTKDTQCAACPAGQMGDAADPTRCTLVCLHGGTPVPSPQPSLCDCPPGTRGDHCEICTVSMSAGPSYNCALQSDQTLICWGMGALAPAGSFKSVSVGVDVSCAIRTDGTLACWNTQGSPLTVPEGAFSAVSAGYGSACAVDLDGTIQCWGMGMTPAKFATPVALPDAGFVSVATGAAETCGMTTGGTVLCNGVADHGGPFTQLSANGLDICGVKIDGTLACWGATFFSPTMTNATFKSISVGFSHLCAVNPDDSVSCFGDNMPPGAPSGKFSSVAAGMTHDCAVREEGSIVCWGSNDFAESSPPKQPDCAVLHMVHDPIDGHCVCPPDAPNQCAAALCADLQTDRTHCGTCDTACPISADCVAGACVCPATLSDLCDGNCVNLTSDPHHCGQCGTACPAGAICNAGTCSVGPTQIATLPNCITPRMTLTNGAFFVTDPQSSMQSVLMVTAATGEVTPLAHAGSFAGPIVSDANGVYWVDGNAIMKQSLPAVSKPQVVITIRTPAQGLAVANGSLYFSFGNLYSIPVDGSSVGAGDGGLPGTLLVATDEFGFVSLAVNDAHVAYMTGQYGEIASNTLDGNNRLLLAYGQTALIQDLIQITSSHAYWANGSQVLRVLLDRKDSSEAVASVDGTVTGFTLTDSNLYLATADGRILRTSLGPGAPLELLARDQGGATSLRHDSMNLYWLDATCHIMQQPL